MPTSKHKPIPHSVIADLQSTGEASVYNVIYKATRFRYLFDGGATCDVIAIQDGSDLRSWVLTVTGHPGIVGVAIVEPDVDTVTFMSGPL